MKEFTIKMEVNKRYKSVDITKGFLILLVIISHIPNIVSYSPYLIRWIHSFFMPSFFVLSGLFFMPKKTTSLLKKKFYTLLIPYGVFTLWGWLAWIGRTIIKHDTNNSELYLFIIGGNNYNGVLWFLLALFFVNVIVNEIVKIHNKWFQYVVALLISFCAYTLQDSSLLGMYSFRSALLCVPFFLISYNLKNYILSSVGRQRILFFVSVLVCIVLYYYNNIMNNLAAGIIRWSYVSFYVYVFFITYILLYISNIIEKKKVGNILAYIGERSLGVMCVHLAFINGQYFILSITPCYWINIGVLFFVVLFESIVFTNVLIKHFPIALGKIGKHRQVL